MSPEDRNLPHRGITVQFDSVSFSYGDLPVLENASFHLHKGEFVALVGPNGSGKTTVLKLILGLERPVAGSVKFFGKAVSGAGKQPAGKQPDDWRNRIGYIPQHPPADQTFPVTVRDVVRMGLLRPWRGYGPETASAVTEALEQAGVADLAARSWRALSGGQRRRVLVARALASRPELLILDEPTANMDTESEERLFETLGKLKGDATILIVTHDMDFVSVLTDRVLCMGDDTTHHGIVQHYTEVAPDAHRGVGGARVLHGENIPDNECCGHCKLR